MFSREVVCTDQFIEMPPTAQALYLQLAMSADDDGFVASPNAIAKGLYGAKRQLDLLKDNGYIIPFRSGVIVITHWRVCNTLQNDRYKPTKFTAEFSQLAIQNNTYARVSDDICIPNVT